MAITAKTSAKTTAAKKPAAPKVSVRRSVRSSKTISPALADFSERLADAVHAGLSLGSLAAEMSARRATAEVALARGTRSKAKAAVHADIEHEAAIVELLPLLAHHGMQARGVAEEMLRTYGGLDEAKAAIHTLQLKIAAMPTSVKAPAKKKENRAKKNVKILVASSELVVAEAIPAVAYVPTLESASVALAVGRVTAADVLFFKSLRSDLTWKLAYRQARAQLSRLCKLQGGSQEDRTVLRMSTPSLYPGIEYFAGDWQDMLDAKKKHSERRVGAHKDWPEWMTRPKKPVDFYSGGIGWVPSNGHDFDGGTTGAKIKKSRPAGYHESRETARKGGKASTYGAGQKDKTWQPTDERTDEHEAGKPCVVVSGCKILSKYPWKNFHYGNGMERADGKDACRIHGPLLSKISNSNLDPSTRARMVDDLLDRGQEPDPDLLASAQPAKRQAPVPAYAVKDGTATAVLFDTAFRAIFAMPSGNGNGNAPVMSKVACKFCSAPAKFASWKFGKPENVRDELLELANGQPVCVECGAGLFHLGGNDKVPQDKQPVDVAGVLEWATKAKEHFAKRGGNNAPAPMKAKEMTPKEVEEAARKLYAPTWEQVGLTRDEWEIAKAMDQAGEIGLISGRFEIVPSEPARPTYYRDEVHLMKPVDERGVPTAPAASDNKPPCPIPGCKLVLLKVNPFKSQVPGMAAANGTAFCGVHVKALAQIAHAQVTAEKRAEMVNALLHPQPANDGFAQALDAVDEDAAAYEAMLNDVDMAMA